MTEARGTSRWWVVAAMSAASIVLTIDLFGVNVALPTIADELDLSDSTLQWVVSIYFLALAAPLVAAGRLGDLFGRRRVLLIGAMAAGVGSLLAAIAPNGEVLLLARAISGVGAAFVTALSLSIVSEAFPPERRGLAIGLWSGVGAVGAAAGPLVGGLITETLGWRWLFAIDVPVAVAAMVVTIVVVAESRDPNAKRVDVAGVVLVTAGFGLLSFGLLEGPEAGWADPGVVGALGAGLGALVAFVRVELRTREPLVRMSWIARRPALGTNLVALAGNAAFATVMLYLTLYFQGLEDFSPISTGVAFLAFTIPLGLASPVAGALTSRMPPARVMAGGMVLLTAGAAVLTFLGRGSSVVVAYSGLALSGLGQAAVFNVTNIAEVTSVPDAQAGMAAGVVSGIRQVGSLLGLAAAGAVYAAHAVPGVLNRVRDTTGAAAAGLADGVSAAMFVTVGFCVAGLVAVAWARPAPALVSRPASRPR